MSGKSAAFKIVLVAESAKALVDNAYADALQARPVNFDQ